MVAKKGVKASEDDAVEDLARVPLQAIILADSFSTKLGPITLECPKVLLPLVNTPMIDYTLAWLECAGVGEVFVLCCSHSKQIISYLDKSKWVNRPNFSVTTIESHNCASAGDALRLIYKRDAIQGDFILVSGDTVSNMMLTEALEEHKERQRKDKDAVMTMVIKQSEPSQVTRLGTDELIMAIDPTTKELLYYEDKADDVKFDESYLTINPCFALHDDKQDCYIDICSPQVLSLFTDNYDCQHLRHHFVKGLVVDDLLTGFKIFTHEIPSSCYAARIDNFGSYDSISKDIIQRQTYPFVPDVQLSINHHPSKSEVGSFTYIGKDTIIGNNTVISNSAVGDGCKIGSNVVIDGCYIWNNVTIRDGCKLRHAILCDEAVMKSWAVLEPGVVLSYEVVVGQGFVVPSCSKVSLLPQPDNDEEHYADDSDSGRIITVTDNNLENINDICGVVSDVGEDGRGFIWSMNGVDHEEEWRHLPMPKSDTRSDDEIFEQLVEEIFLRGVHVDPSGVLTLHELQSLQVSFGMDPAECVGALLCSIMKLALNNTSNNSGKKDLAKETCVLISEWRILLKPFLLGDIDEKVEVISKFEEICLESVKEYAPLFVKVLSVLYDEDIIREEAILKWANGKEHADESDKVFVKQSDKFIQCLKLKEASKEKDREFQAHLETDLKRLNEGGVQLKRSRRPMSQCFSC